jgi:hypothetical protein
MCSQESSEDPRRAKSGKRSSHERLLGTRCIGQLGEIGDCPSCRCCCGKKSLEGGAGGGSEVDHTQEAGLGGAGLVPRPVGSASVGGCSEGLVWLSNGRPTPREAVGNGLGKRSKGGRS